MKVYTARRHRKQHEVQDPDRTENVVQMGEEAAAILTRMESLGDILWFWHQV